MCQTRDTAVTYTDELITHHSAQNLYLTSSQAFAIQLLFMSTSDHLSLHWNFFSWWA